jgi:hypothetical protein
MASVRFAGTPENQIATPPSGKAFLFFDDSDNTFKARLDDGSIILLTLTEEYIQDLIGNFFQDSSTISVVYDDNNNIISLEIAPSSINTTHVDSISPLKIIDNQNQRYQSNIITNNNLPTMIQLLECGIDGVWLVEARVTCFRIGGLAGIPGTSATLRRTFRIKSINSSVTVHDIQSDYTSRDNPQLNWGVSVSGTNVEFLVYGLNNNNIRWNMDLIINNNN